MEDHLVRLSKLMSERGICSRREADRYIEQGQVLVDGEIVSELGSRVSPNCHIALRRESRYKQESKVTILLNKPLGYVSTQPEKGYIPAIELIHPDNQFSLDTQRFDESHLDNLNVAGRLDIDSKGLLVLTQDGTVVKTIIGPDADLEKEYIVSVIGTITDQMIDELTYGLELDGKPLKEAIIEQLDYDLLKIILREGKKRQIRRMCELVGLKVKKLKRVRVGNVMLGHLPEGQWRYLKPNEFF